MGRTLRCALALSLGLLAVGCSKDPSTPAYWEDQLDAAQRPSEKVRVLETLRSSKRLDKRFAPMLNARLASEKSPETRAVIARALGELKDPSSVEPLAASLDVNTADGATSRMNAAIAQALGDIRDPRGAPALISLLRSRDDYVRQDAIAALGELRATAAVPTLVELALDDKSPPAVNRRAIVALGEVGDPRAIPTLLKAMFKQRGNTVFAQEASYSLFQIGKPAADALTAVLEGRDRDLAAWARANDVVEAVVLVRAAESLGDFATTTAEPALVRQLSYRTAAPEQTLYARMAAASTLGKMRSAAGRAALEGMLDEPEPLARAEYARALVLIGGREAVPALQRSAGHGPWEARQYAIGALGMLGDERDQPTMDRIAADEPKLTAADCKRYGCNLPVEEVAANRLKTVKIFQAPLRAAGQCKASLDCWAGKLGDPDGPVRQRAALELGRMGKAQAVMSLSDHLADKEPETRAAVLQALMWLVQGDGAAARQLVPLLPKMEQQLSSDRGRQDYAATSEQLRRLITEVRRRGEQA
ncbi:MAG TPA: HEAT repeat domain-containing protein [Myxococcaceae bacterium]|nr:HEAT repeat domain-containing protein [Myxococcaceae bacterium]